MHVDVELELMGEARQAGARSDAPTPQVSSPEAPTRAAPTSEAEVSVATAPMMEEAKPDEVPLINTPLPRAPKPSPRLLHAALARVEAPQISAAGRVLSRVAPRLLQDDPQARVEILRQLSDSLRLRGDGGVQRAEIQLKPADLGLVQVEVRMEGGALSVLLLAEQPMTQAALRQSGEQLSQMFVAQGLPRPRIDVRKSPKKHEPAPDEPERAYSNARLDLRI